MKERIGGFWMTKRNEKDVSMSRDEFNKYVATALMSGSKKIAYCKIEETTFMEV